MLDILDVIVSVKAINCVFGVAVIIACRIYHFAHSGISVNRAENQFAKLFFNFRSPGITPKIKFLDFFKIPFFVVLLVADHVLPVPKIGGQNTILAIPTVKQKPTVNATQ
jgi:hypothetical protein